MEDLTGVDIDNYAIVDFEKVIDAIGKVRALALNGEDNKMTTAELEGHPTSLPDGEQVLVPDDEANEAILQDFRQ
jgi:anionic cell wall polymer biosynthesis LytR-Cps2A-Psr (LCP) family protein